MEFLVTGMWVQLRWGYNCKNKKWQNGLYTWFHWTSGAIYQRYFFSSWSYPVCSLFLLLASFIVQKDRVVLNFIWMYHFASIPELTFVFSLNGQTGLHIHPLFWLEEWNVVITQRKLGPFLELKWSQALYNTRTWEEIKLLAHLGNKVRGEWMLWRQTIVYDLG